MAITLKVFQGTPVHGERSLCMSCAHAQVVQGLQVSDLKIWCGVMFDHQKRMMRPVVECSDFRRRTDRSLKDMERMAWILETKKGRHIGFFSPTDHKIRAKNEELDEPDED